MRRRKNKQNGHKRKQTITRNKNPTQQLTQEKHIKHNAQEKHKPQCTGKTHQTQYRKNNKTQSAKGKQNKTMQGREQNTMRKTGNNVQERKTMHNNKITYCTGQKA